MSVKYLLEELRTCQSMKEIDLSRARIDDGCMECIGQYIKENKCLEKISLARNIDITSKGIEILAPFLFNNTSLKRIDFEGCRYIKKKAIPTILSIIEQSRIEDLNLYSTGIRSLQPFNFPIARNKILNRTSRFSYYYW